MTSNSPNIMHCSLVSQMFRELATWIDQHGVTPWHIEYDWQNQCLLIHLSASIFFELFPSPIEVSDYMGTTWYVIDNGLRFQCYLSHESQLNLHEQPQQPKHMFQFKESA